MGGLNYQIEHHVSLFKIVKVGEEIQWY
jgi:hypothetical protein